MDRMKTPAEILREIDGLDPFTDPDYAPKIEAVVAAQRRISSYDAASSLLHRLHPRCGSLRSVLDALVPYILPVLLCGASSRRAAR